MNPEKLSEILKQHELWLKTRFTDNVQGQRADLRGAYLRGADLRGADLQDAYLRGADLQGAYLRGAYLQGAYLRGAYLRGADLRGAYLQDADLRGAAPIQCPEDGSFIGFKKAVNIQKDGITSVIVKLKITENAKRSSATSRKCRCSEAEVLSITSIDGTVNYDNANSRHNRTFEYKVGEIVKVDDFDDNRWNECSTGIHFFITRQEAVDY